MTGSGPFSERTCPCSIGGKPTVRPLFWGRCGVRGARRVGMERSRAFASGVELDQAWQEFIPVEGSREPIRHPSLRQEVEGDGPVGLVGVSLRATELLEMICHRALMEGAPS